MGCIHGCSPARLGLQTWAAELGCRFGLQIWAADVYPQTRRGPPWSPSAALPGYPLQQNHQWTCTRQTRRGPPCLVVKNGPPIPGEWLSSPQPVNKSWSPGIHPRIPPIPRIPAIRLKCDLAGSSQPPFLAPGARMTVVKHTPSNN